MRDGKALDTLDAAVADSSLEILGLQDIDGAGGEDEQVAAEGVVVGQIGLGAEEANFHKPTGYEFLGIGMEEEHGGTIQVSTLGELELFHESGARCAEIGRVEASALPGEVMKSLESGGRKVGGLYAGHRNTVPCAAMAAEEKAVERGSF